MMTTFTSYGRVEDYRQGEIIKALGETCIEDDRLQDLFHNFVAQVR